MNCQPLWLTRLNQPGLTPPQCPWGLSWRWPQVASAAARRCRRGKCRSSHSPPVLQAHNQAQAFTNTMRLIKRGNVYISVSMPSLFSGSFHVRRGKCRSSHSPPVLEAHNQAQAFTNTMRLIKRGNVYISASMPSLFSGSFHVRPNCHLLWVHSVPRVFALQKIFTNLSQPLKTTFFYPNLKNIFKYTIRLY